MEPYLLLEPREKYPSERVLERLLHCIWSEQLFRKTLVLENKPLQISSPGWWNLEAGPDFRNAEIFWDGARLCGDVEIHLTTGDWYQHRHHLDKRYNNVVLHVVLHKSQQACVKQNGEVIPEVEMKDHLLEELQLLQQRIPLFQFPFGPGTGIRLCRRFLEEQSEASVIHLMDSAGDERMRRKKERLLPIMRQSGFLQAFYQAFMEGMIYNSPHHLSCNRCSWATSRQSRGIVRLRLETGSYNISSQEMFCLLKHVSVCYQRRSRAVLGPACPTM